METTPTTAVRAMMTDLEDLWRKIDEILNSLSPADWSRKHGKDWTFADVPYHLSYFDREIIVSGILRGTDVPENERRPMRTMTELNAWNAHRFAERPAGQTVEQSLGQMRAARDAIRAAASSLSDADLDRPAWAPLPRMGWTTVRKALEGCTAHTWNHLMELRLRLRRSSPTPTPSETHRALGFYLGLFPSMVNQAQAAKTRFTGVMEFTGPGGGTWSINVDNGLCRSAEGRAAQPDLVMTQSAETFQATMIGAQNPMLAMLRGKIKVRGLRSMPTFGKLFPPPKPDTVFLSAEDTAPTTLRNPV